MVKDTDPKGPDPLLTQKGKNQINKTKQAWKKEIQDGIPLPEVLYSSPLRRAIDTVEITWDGLLPGGDRLVCPLVSFLPLSQSPGLVLARTSLRLILPLTSQQPGGIWYWI
jgi:bisphosphoglycerate-dependent phosphoglycerate mutase